MIQAVLVGYIFFCTDMEKHLYMIKTYLIYVWQEEPEGGGKKPTSYEKFPVPPPLEQRNK